MNVEDLKALLTQATADGYKKGKAEADEERAERWLPPVDPKLVAKAKALEYISLAEIKQARKIGAKKKQEVVLPVGEGARKVKMVIDEDDDQDNIKWIEFLALWADLIDYICVHGGHPEKLGEVLNHYRLLQKLGSDQTFTYDSLMEYDTHIRSRKEGQGPFMSWRFDSTTRHVILKDFVQKEKAKKKVQVRPKPTTKVKSGTCFEWAQGKVCKFGDDCKWYHSCNPCDVKAPKAHDITNCPRKDELQHKKKK